MDKKSDAQESDLPPAPGPDSWSPAEAADWDPDEEETPQAADGDGG